ncbi:signal peptidase I [Ferrovibrio sp.]|jgi:signal peptidase I|uniref:signal peptidase I n=1 Tax=Ferrovibrio sp. TaxID=1917215 RepID=UPI0035AE4AD8
MDREQVVAKHKTRGGELWDSLRTLVYAVLIALGIRTVAYEPFHIPSESMLPTLLVGDYVFVSKYAYGYSKYSLLFSPPIFEGRILGSEPKRGDVVVFRWPHDPSVDYIKRLIGLPGDRIQMREGVLYLNGEPVKRRRVEDFERRDRFGNLVERNQQWEETLPADGKNPAVTYRTLDLYAYSSSDNTGVYTVPPGHYFMMGDNRDNSQDSRVALEVGGVGYVPSDHLIGRADVRWISIEPSASLLKPWTWFSALRWNRMFTGID